MFGGVLLTIKMNKQPANVALPLVFPLVAFMWKLDIPACSDSATALHQS
jgi:hypothetical protein